MRISLSIGMIAAVKYRNLLAFCFGLLLPVTAQASSHGWDYLIDKLTEDGIPRERAVAVFEDPRVAPFDGLEFRPDRPRERKSIYTGFLKPNRVADARRCRQQHAHRFEAAAKQFGVSADVVAAILFVETGCGRNTGKSIVFHRLARLAMANEPENLQRNFDRFRDRNGDLDPSIEERLRGRARYLEDTFYPEVRAVFEVADRLGIEPLELRGSVSGAFGFPQFLPTSYLRFGVDGNQDGHVSLYEISDASASCAHYLSKNGWHPRADRTEKREAIWSYNHSDAYIDTVLGLAEKLGRPPEKTQVAKKKPAPKKAKPSQVASRSKK